MIFNRMSLGDAKKMHGYLKDYKAILLKSGTNIHDLKVFDVLMKNLSFYTNGFRHDYGFTKLVRNKKKRVVKIKCN